MRSLALLELLFGLLILGAGLYGYFSFGDDLLLPISIAGAIAMVFVGLRTQKGWRPGLLVGTIFSLGVIGYFGYYFLDAGAPFVPYGLLPTMGIVAILLTLLIIVQPKERTREF